MKYKDLYNEWRSDPEQFWMHAAKNINWVKINLLPTKESRPHKSNRLFAKKPKWLRVKLPSGEKFQNLRGLVDKHKLHTICESGNCPNMGEC